MTHFLIRLFVTVSFKATSFKEVQAAVNLTKSHQSGKISHLDFTIRSKLCFYYFFTIFFTSQLNFSWIFERFITAVVG